MSLGLSTKVFCHDKEMRPSHRIDILTDALLHYRRKTSGKIGIFTELFIFIIYICTLLGHLLCKRMDRAKKLHSDALKGLMSLKDDPIIRSCSYIKKFVCMYSNYSCMIY